MPRLRRGILAWCEHGGVKRLPWQIEQARGALPAASGFIVLVPCSLGSHFLVADQQQQGRVVEVVVSAAVDEGDDPNFFWPTREAAAAAIEQFEQQEAEADHQLDLE